MKRSVMIVIVLAVTLGGVVFFKTSTIEVTNDTQVVEKEKVVPELQKRLQEAKSASSTEIQSAMDKASQDAKIKIEGEIESRVIDQMQAELDARKDELEKQESF